jgi:hypothetical protein
MDPDSDIGNDTDKDTHTDKDMDTKREGTSTGIWTTDMDMDVGNFNG